MTPTEDPSLTLRPDRAVDRDDLRATVEALAGIERAPGSRGERAAAAWIADRMRGLGCEVRVDDERAWPGYARPLTGLCLLGVVAGAASLTRRGRIAGALGGLLVAAGIAEDISNGPRLFRRATTRPQPTQNVVAASGDREAAHTLVLLAHHDAAPTGRIFDPTLQERLGEMAPGILERIDTSLPIWWPVVASPALVAAGGLQRRRGMSAIGLIGCATCAAAFADIARSPTVPGANDNLSAVAALVAVAAALRDRPLSGLRVLLVSCGSEEVIQGGIHGFAERHLRRLDRDRTWVLNLDTVGSPELIMLEGEGPLVMEDYHARSFRDLVAATAERVRIPMRRGMRARSSTDAVVPSRAGYPTATLASMNRHKALSNYHLMSDTPENLELGTVARAAAVCEAVARELAEAVA